MLHCCCALPEDRGRQVLINNLLALGADPRVEDIDGWAPRDSDFVSTAESSHEALLAPPPRRGAEQRPRLLPPQERWGPTEGPTGPLGVQWKAFLQSAIARLRVPKRRQRAALVCEQLGSAGRALALDQVPRARLTSRGALGLEGPPADPAGAL